MERRIIICDKMSGSNITITEDINTYNQLFEIIRRNVTDLSNKNITNGATKEEILDSSDVIPSEFHYNGRSISDIVVIVTSKTKKTPFGASNMTRGEAYEIIKANNYGEEIKRVYGRNYTVITTDELVKFINEKRGTSTPSCNSCCASSAPATYVEGCSNASFLEDTGIVGDLEDLKDDLREIQYYVTRKIKSLEEWVDELITAHGGTSTASNQLSEDELDNLLDEF